MKETALLAAIWQVIRCIEIHNDLFWCHLMEIRKQIRQQPVQMFLIGHDLVVTMPLSFARIAWLQTIQRARTH